MNNEELGSTVNLSAVHCRTPELQGDFDRIALRYPIEMARIVQSNIVITGSSGFVGKWLIGGWLSAKKIYGGEGHILLTSRKPRSVVELFPELDGRPDVEFLSVDIRSLGSENNFLKIRPDVVIHGATSASQTLNRSQPREMMSVVVDGTRSILDEAIRLGTRRLINLSSGAVYGQQHALGTLIREDDPSAPNLERSDSSYHESKRMAELICNIAHEEGHLEVINLRLFTFLAPFLPFDTHFAAGNFMLSAVRGQTLEVKSGGGSVRSYMYGSDLASAIFLTCIRELQHRTYNIGSPNPISISDLARLIRRRTELQAPVVIEGRDSLDVTNYVPSIKRFEQDSGFKIEVDHELLIDKTYRWAVECLRSSDGTREGS